MAQNVRTVARKGAEQSGSRKTSSYPLYATASCLSGSN
jgi:hypothetical protein